MTNKSKKLVDVGEDRHRKLKKMVADRMVKSGNDAIKEALDMYFKFNGQGPRTTTLYNLKGGVAKTTTNGHLAYGLSKLGRKVLAVDFDPQGNLSMMFDSFDMSKPSIYEVLNDKAELKDTIVNVSENLDIIPSNLKLTFLNFMQVPAKEFMLKGLLEQVSGYDYILIDCPPEFGLFTMNALATVDSVHVPVQPGRFAVEGMLIFDEIMKLARKHLRNPKVKVSSIFFTLVDSRIKFHGTVQNKIKEAYAGVAKDISIPRSSAVEYATAECKTIFEYKMNSKPTLGFIKLIAEFLREEEGIDLVHDEIREALK